MAKFSKLGVDTLSHCQKVISIDNAGMRSPVSDMKTKPGPTFLFMLAILVVVPRLTTIFGSYLLVDEEIVRGSAWINWRNLNKKPACFSVPSPGKVKSQNMDPFG